MVLTTFCWASVIRNRYTLLPMLHDVLSKHLRSIRYPEDFLTANHTVLTFLHDLMPMIRCPDHASFTVRNFLPARPNSAQTELCDPVADVPYAKGKRRNASARERQKPIPKQSAASSSRPPNSNATHHSSGAVHTQSSSRPQAQAAVSTSSAAPAVAVHSGATTTTSSTNPHAMIKHAGRWTRFWLFVASPEYTDGHH